MLEFKLKSAKQYKPPKIKPLKKIDIRKIWAPYPEYVLEKSGQGLYFNYNLPDW